MAPHLWKGPETDCQSHEFSKQCDMPTTGNIKKNLQKCLVTAYVESQAK